MKYWVSVTARLGNQKQYLKNIALKNRLQVGKMTKATNNVAGQIGYNAGYAQAYPRSSGYDGSSYGHSGPSYGHSSGSYGHSGGGYGHSDGGFGHSGGGYGHSSGGYGHSGGDYGHGGGGGYGYGEPSYASYSGGYGKMECPGIPIALLLITLLGIAVLGAIFLQKVLAAGKRRRRRSITVEDLVDMVETGRGNETFMFMLNNHRSCHFCTHIL